MFTLILSTSKPKPEKQVAAEEIEEQQQLIEMQSSKQSSGDYEEK